MAIEPDLSYSWLPPSTSTPSTIEEVDLSTLAPADLMPSSHKAIKSSPHLMAPLDTLDLQEESFVLTPVTQPFQIQVCLDQDLDGERGHSSNASPFSVLQEPLNDPMLPFGSSNHMEAIKSTPGHSGSSISGCGYTCLSSHFSPVSVHSLADSGVSSISENASSERLLAPNTPSYLDFDLDQIVEDVDDMFRERYEALERQKEADEDSAKTSDLIKRNMPPEYFFTYTSKNPEELAHDLARSLVDKALESDRKKYLEQDSSVNLDEILENWTEVAGNRAMEAILDDLIESAMNEITTSIFYGFGGDFSRFQKMSHTNFVSPSEVLQDELDVLVSDIFAESDESCLVSKKFGLYQISGPSRLYDFKVPSSRQKIEEKAFMTRWKGNTPHTCTDECNKNRRTFITAKMRREAERKRRNRAGILVSSLKKKVYHCRCIDCQQERETQGVPEPHESIEVKELTVPENLFPKEGIPILRKQGRGRPRKYPRVEDFRRWFVEQERKKDEGGEIVPRPPSTTECPPIVKKRPRGRPPKYQVSFQPHQKDNLKMKLSRKRPSRTTYSKVNYIDCDSSDEGYSESVKETSHDDKLFLRTYKIPGKQIKLTPDSENTHEKGRSSSPMNNKHIFEPPIKTATNDIVSVKSYVPQSEKDILENNSFINESCMDLQETPPSPEPIIMHRDPTVKETNSALTIAPLPSDNITSTLSSPYLSKEDSDTQFIIIQEVAPELKSSFTTQMRETGIQTNTVESSSGKVSFGLEKQPKKIGILVSKSSQTDISLYTSAVSTKCCSTQSISTSTDISVCSSTNELIQTKHLIDPKEKNETKKDITNEGESCMPNNVQLNPQNNSSFENLPIDDVVLSENTPLKESTPSSSQIKTYSRSKTASRHAQVIQNDSFGISTGDSKEINLISSSSELCPQLLQYEDTIASLMMDLKFGKSLSLENEVYDENETLREPGLIPCRPPHLKQTKESLSSTPKVIIKRLTQGVIDSWCNRFPLRSSAQCNGLRHISLSSSFNDEIHLMCRRNTRTVKEQVIPLHEYVVDAVLPSIRDKEFLRASKPLPVNVST